MKPVETETTRPCTIVVVDDDPAICAALDFALQAEGFLVRAYHRGADLLADSKLPSRGCLVIDYKMPNMNGLETIANLRLRGVVLPAILITSAPSDSLRARAAKAGVAVVEKPLFGDALIETIHAAIGAAVPQR